MLPSQHESCCDPLPPTLLCRPSLPTTQASMQTSIRPASDCSEGLEGNRLLILHVGAVGVESRQHSSSSNVHHHTIQPGFLLQLHMLVGAFAPSQEHTEHPALDHLCHHHPPVLLTCMLGLELLHVLAPSRYIFLHILTESVERKEKGSTCIYLPGRIVRFPISYDFSL